MSNRTAEVRADERRERRAGYSFAMTLQKNMVEVEADSSPEQFLRIAEGMARLLGYDWRELGIRIYARKGDELWRPIYGVSDSTPVLLPMPVSGENELSDEEYHELGHQIVNAYMVIQDRITKVQAYSRRWDDTEVKKQRMVDELTAHLHLIESAVVGTQWEKVFLHKYQRQEKQWIAAKSLNVATRTLNRHVRQMMSHIGRMLHETLTPRKLKEILLLGQTKNP